MPLTFAQQRSSAVLFGVLFIGVLLVMAVAIRCPTPFQYTVFRIVLALAAAGAAAMIPGFLKVDLSTGIRAGGALAVFVIVFFFTPAAISDKGQAECTASVSIPGNTGWIFGGYFHISDSTFDATGPRFTFVKRRTPRSIMIPEKGDIIALTTERAVMIKDYQPRQDTGRSQDLICMDFDPNRDDTGKRLPRATRLAVMDIGQYCEDPTQSGGQAALWLRVTLATK